MRIIINRYLGREVLQAWALVTGVLLFILLSNQFSRVLGDAAKGKLPREAVLQVLGLTSITHLTVLIPVALFLAVMLALGRLYKDSEMAAIRACGIGPLRIYQPIATLSLVLAALLAWLSLYASPWAAARAEIIVEEARQEAGIGAVEPGRFSTSGAPGVVFYAESVENGLLRKVFLQRRSGDTIELAVADSGEIRTDPVSGEKTMVLRDGRRYEGVPGTTAFRIIRFGEHGLPISAGNVAATRPDREALPTLALLRSATAADAAELHWRLAAPISAMLLGLLAVPLARTNPRQGRYGKLAIGVGVYLVYANLLGAAQAWIEQGALPPLVGMWPVHGLLALAAGLLLWRESRLRRPRRSPAA